MKIKCTFWNDIVLCWSYYNYYSNFRIENQIIWYNSEIKVGGKIIMWRDVYLRGLKYVHQLYRYCHLKSDKEVWEEFGLTSLRYNSLNQQYH